MASKQLLGVVTPLTLLSTVACGDAKNSTIGDSNGSGGSAHGGSLVLVPVAGSSTGTGGAGNGAPPGTLPDGFTKVDVGGYQLGEPITSDSGTGTRSAPIASRGGIYLGVLGA